MVLYKLLKSESRGCPGNDYCWLNIGIDLGSTYLLGRIVAQTNSGNERIISYSVDCNNYEQLARGYGPLSWEGKLYARCVAVNSVTIDYIGKSLTLSVYELLFTASLSASVDKTVVEPNSQFTVSGNVKDQYNNPMKDQVINIKIYKSGVLFSTASATADENGNFSKPISTVGWSPDTYKVEVVSDDITQSVDVTVTYMSSVKFDTTCLDTGLACPAYVYVDGILKGITPVTVGNLPVGNHGYKVSKEGYNDATGTVNVQQGVIAEISISLTPVAKGSIFFNSAPVGAEIFLDDTDQGIRTPYNIEEVPVGVHSYILKLSGFKDYEGTVPVEANITSTVDVELTPGEGCIYFVTSIPGAKIYVDNVDTGKVTPALICGLSLGSHTYKLELSGYKTVTGSVGIGAGQGVVVASVLTPVEKGMGAGTLLGLTIVGLGVFGAVLFATREKKPGVR